jgi:hypothetical protein
MSLFIYKWGEDDNGETGWISKMHDNFDVSYGDLIVHDVIEHFPRGHKHGGAVDELLALGARAWIRIESGWFWRGPYTKIQPKETWGYEIRRIAEHNDLDSIPRAKPIDEIESDCDCDLVACLPFAAKEINEYHMEIENEDHVDLKGDEPDLVNCLYWFRRGVLAAQKRYKGRSADEVMWLADQMKEELTNPRFANAQDGDELHIRVHEKDMEFKITHKSLYN